MGVSKEILNRACELFKDRNSATSYNMMKKLKYDHIPHNTHDLKSGHEENINSENMTFTKAGSSKKIPVSEESLNEADRILKDQYDNSKSNEGNATTQKVMFSTAGTNKVVNVSEESINRANEILKDKNSAKSCKMVNELKGNNMSNNTGYFKS